MTSEKLKQLTDNFIRLTELHKEYTNLAEETYRLMDEESKKNLYIVGIDPYEEDDCK